MYTSNSFSIYFWIKCDVVSRVTVIWWLVLFQFWKLGKWLSVYQTLICGRGEIIVVLVCSVVEKATCEEDEEDDLSLPLEACSALHCGRAAETSSIGRPWNGYLGTVSGYTATLLLYCQLHWFLSFSSWSYSTPDSVQIPAADPECSHHKCI